MTTRRMSVLGGALVLLLGSSSAWAQGGAGGTGVADGSGATDANDAPHPRGYEREVSGRKAPPRTGRSSDTSGTSDESSAKKRQSRAPRGEHGSAAKETDKQPENTSTK